MLLLSEWSVIFNISYLLYNLSSFRWELWLETKPFYCNLVSSHISYFYEGGSF